MFSLRFTFCIVVFLFSVDEWPTKTGQRLSPHRHLSPPCHFPAPTPSASPLLVILQLQCLLWREATLPTDEKKHTSMHFLLCAFRDTLYRLSFTIPYISCSFQSGFFCQSSWNFRKSNITHSFIQFKSCNIDVDFAKSSVFEIRRIWYVLFWFLPCLAYPSVEIYTWMCFYQASLE